MTISELTLKSSGPEPARRFEVFTGSGRRRDWLPEEKARIVAESYETVESVIAVARRYALSPQQLFAWRRAARVPLAESPAPEPWFVPAVVAEPMSELAATRPAKQRKRKEETKVRASSDQDERSSHRGPPRAPSITAQILECRWASPTLINRRCGRRPLQVRALDQPTSERRQGAKFLVALASNNKIRTICNHSRGGKRRGH